MDANSHPRVESEAGLSSPELIPARYIVALDFGTSHSGFACCQKDDPTHIVSCMAWPDQPMPYAKTLTAILYNEKQQPVAWGHSARVQYTKLKTPGYQYFSSFKLFLDDEYAAANPPPAIPVETLIADYLRCMAKQIEHTLRARFGSQASLEHVQWCLTVPAMWSDRAKQVMRNAAVSAGLIHAITSDRLTLVLEPEAAAATALQGNSSVLQPGDTFIVFDAGGGTVDLTAQQYHVDASNGPCFHEIAPGIGKSCGSTFLDQAFLAHYRTSVGHTAYDAWTAADPLGPLHLLHAWESTKRSFAGPPYADAHAVFDTLPIPSKLRKRMEPATLTLLAEAQDSDSDTLWLTPFTLMHIVDAVVQACMDVLHAMLSRCVRTGRPVSKVVCVGGFAQSPLLVNRMRMEFESPEVQVLCPAEPGSAVLLGALQFGQRARPVYAQRRARMTYGVATTSEWKPSMPVARRVYDARAGRYLARGKVFDVLVRFGDEVGPESVVRRTYTAPEPGTERLALELYATTDVQPVFCDDEAAKCIKLADFMVPVGGAAGRHGDLAEALAVTRVGGRSALPRVEVGLHFGNAELRVSATNVATGEVTQVHVEFSDTDVDLSKVGRRPTPRAAVKRTAGEDVDAAEARQTKRRLVFGMADLPNLDLDLDGPDIPPAVPATDPGARAAAGEHAAWIPTVRSIDASPVPDVSPPRRSETSHSGSEMASSGADQNMPGMSPSAMPTVTQTAPGELPTRGALASDPLPQGLEVVARHVAPTPASNHGTCKTKPKSKLPRAIRSKPRVATPPGPGSDRG